MIKQSNVPPPFKPVIFLTRYGLQCTGYWNGHCYVVANLDGVVINKTQVIHWEGNTTKRKLYWKQEHLDTLNAKWLQKEDDEFCYV